MTGFAGVASLSVDYLHVEFDSRLRSIAGRMSAFGSEMRALRCRGAAAMVLQSADYPDNVGVHADGDLLRIVQARRLHIAGDGGDRSEDDASRLLRVFAQRGMDVFPRVRGDFLFLQWDARRARLTCVRAPLTEIPFYLSVQGGTVEWASLAPALGAGRPPDLRTLATQYSGRSTFGQRGTAFDGVWASPPGVIATVDSSGVSEKRFWDPADEADEPRSDAVAANAVRVALDDAIGESLETAGPIVASHLSAGRDSSAISALAALRLAKEGGCLHAFTAVPVAGYANHAGRYLLDEGPDAACFAAAFPAITHHRVASSKEKLGALLDNSNRHSALGHANAVSLIWWNRILALARAAGATTLLTGDMGNFTISGGGPWVIPGLLRAGQPLLWQRRLREAARHPDASLKNLLASSLLPLLPKGIGQALNRQRRAAHGSQVASLPPFFRGELAEASRLIFADGGWKEPLLNRDLVLDCLRTADLADPGPWLHHKIVLRDPTADRRVVRAGLRLTAAQLASPYDRRPLYEMAFKDVVPDATLRQPRRGHQGADWNKMIDVVELRDSVRRYGENKNVSALIDIEGLLAALDHWPEGVCCDGPIYMLLVVRALPAIALASFLNLHFPD